MDLQNLTEIAIRFRSALESMLIQERSVTLQDFPRGSCGDATLLLGTYLIEEGFGPFDYMLGERSGPMGEGWTSHAWLEQDDLIIDITADQFPDGPGKVVICRDSTWHAAFHGKRKNVADYRIYDSYTVATLQAAYRTVCSVLKKA
jgi:hypothetical protein